MLLILLLLLFDYVFHAIATILINLEPFSDLSTIFVDMSEFSLICCICRCVWLLLLENAISECIG